MNRLYFYFFAFFITAISVAQNTITMRGSITSPSGTTVYIKSISGYRIVSDSIIDGQFSITHSLEDGYYYLSHGSSTVSIYLTNGDNLKVTFDGQNIDKTIQYQGQGAERNNYLNSASLKFNAPDRDLEAEYRVPEALFEQQLKEKVKQKYQLLKNAQVSSSFLETETINLGFEYLFGLYNYSGMREFYFDENITSSTEFLEPLSDLDFDDNIAYRTYPYYHYLASSYWEDQIYVQESFDEMYRMFYGVKSLDIKQDLLLSFYYDISNKKDKANEYFKLIEQIASSEDFIAEAKEKLKTTLENAPGALAPPFSFNDINGKSVSLSSFKGNYVLIDVWATWCAPCIQQFPALKKLEEKYHNSDIVFVSISVDRLMAYDKWKAMVKEKQLNGIQLFADNSFDSEFIKALGISSIPRFILIDKEGKIMDADLKKPSSQTTQDLLEDLLK